MNKKYSKKTREALRKNDNFRQAVKATAVAITGALQEFLSSQDYTVTKQPDLEELQHVITILGNLKLHGIDHRYHQNLLDRCEAVITLNETIRAREDLSLSGGFGGTNAGRFALLALPLLLELQSLLHPELDDDGL